MTDTSRDPEMEADSFDPSRGGYNVTWEKYCALLDDLDRYKARAEQAEEAGELLRVAATEIGKDPDCGFAQALNDAISGWSATLAQIDDDAQAALERRDARIRNEALEEAAEIAEGFDVEVRDAILALITGDQSDE